MTIEELIKTQIYAHAEQQAPVEACGIVILLKGRLRYIPCTNQLNSEDHFIISPTDYAKAEDLGEIMYIVHSHPKSSPKPSQTDLTSLELDTIPWIIVNPFIKEYSITNPSGYVQPLIGRTYHHGVVDCYTIIRDYYKQVLNIDLSNYPREDLWWETGKNYYNDRFPEQGFELVTDGSVKVGDLFLMRVGANIENHAAIYIGNNRILHHPMNRLSSEEVYGGWWQKITSRVIRHKSLM